LPAFIPNGTANKRGLCFAGDRENILVEKEEIAGLVFRFSSHRDLIENKPMMNEIPAIQRTATQSKSSSAAGGSFGSLPALLSEARLENLGFMRTLYQ
jgi:hypothetical protein